MASRTALALLTVALGAGCGSSATTPVTPEAPRPVSELIDALVIPARDDTTALLEELDRRAASDADAAWARAHYLLDLFDDARFRGDDHSLEVLAEAWDVRPRRGVAATDGAIDRLLIEVDRVLGLDRLHPGAIAARQLLEGDRHGSDVAAFTRHVQTLRRIAASKQALGMSARLRLAGFCERAFRDAARTAPAQRWQRLRMCLPLLHGGDHRAYAGRQRPPFPPWSDLAGDLLALYRGVAESKSRLSRAAAARLAILPTWLDRNRESLPSVPSLDGVPQLEHALPYAWSPVFSDPDGARRQRLDRAVRGDGRSTATWKPGPDARGAELLEAAEVALEAGAARLDLLVRTRFPRAEAPRYWREQPGEDHIPRASVLSFLLPGAGREQTAAVPRGQRWTQAGHVHDLTLVVEPAAWRLVTSRGSVTSGPLDDLDALGAALDRFLDAYPDARAIAIHPAGDVSIAALARIAERLRFRADGDTRLAQLALADQSPGAGRGIRQAIARRSRARVEIDPETLAGRVPVIRRCYQDIVETHPRARAHFELELRGTAVYVVSGPARGALWTCVVPALSDVMSEREIAAARVTLEPR